MDLALDNLQKLIYHETQPTKYILQNNFSVPYEDLCLFQRVSVAIVWSNVFFCSV